MTLDWTQDDRAPDCRVALLNGWWDFAPLYDTKTDKSLPRDYRERILVPSFWNTLPNDLGGDWEAYRNFEWPQKWNKAQAAAFRRSFDLPNRDKRARLRLRFDAILPRAQVFLNGRAVLMIEDGFLPHEADVTDAAEWGADNTLEVLVSAHPAKDGLFLRPAGSWVGWNLRGIWQDCFLRMEPAVRMADVCVRPSVRTHSLEVHTTIENASDSPISVGVDHVVAGESVQLMSNPHEIPPHDSATLSATVAWPDAKLWSPDAPNLYWLETRLILPPSTGPARAEVRRTRFGFKEFWIEGTQFVLNGAPIRFKGDAWHYMGAAQQNPAYAREWFSMIKSIGGNAVRLHAMPYPEFYLDAADEMGVCVIDESAVYGSGGNLALAHDEFWRYAREHVKRLARRDRNHPSVCLWSACNEIVWKGGEASFPKLLSLEDAIHEVDPTRPVSFDENNGDLGGGAKIYGGHYGNTAAWAQHWKRNKPLMVNEFSSLYYSGPEEPSLWGGEECFASFDARTRGAGEEALETIRGLRALGAASITPWNFVWYGLDPAFPFQPATLSPDPSTPGIKTQRIGANSLSINYVLDATRRIEPARPDPYRPDAAFAVMRSGYAAQAAFLREANHEFYDQQTIARHLDVFNDTPASAVLILEASLGRMDRVRRKLDMAPYEHRLEEIELRIPQVHKPTTAPLTIQLSRKPADGPAEQVYRESVECCIVPSDAVRAPKETADRAMNVIDASGETAQLLNALGCGFRRVESTTETLGLLGNSARPGTLVIGKNQLTDRTLHEFTLALRESGFFRRGGILVVLEGAFATDVDAPLNALASESTRAWRRGLEEFWKGLPGDESLRYWSQDTAVPWMNGSVAKTVFRKPSRGAFVPVAEVADGGEGLEFSPLLWLPIENGGVFLNGLELVSNASSQPAAAAILRNMLRWNGGARTETRTPAPAPLCGPGRSSLRELTQLVGARIAPEGPTGHLVVIDASSPVALSATFIDDLRADLHSGATVIVAGVTSDTLPFARKLSGLDLRLRAGTWENVAKTKGKELDPALSGISQDDLTWVRRGQWEPICRLAFEPVDGLEPLVTTVDTRWAGYAESAEQFKYAMMLRRRQAFEGPKTVVGRVPIGEGRILFTQLEVGEARQFTQKARRVWSLLLANAGAEFADEASPLLERRSPFVDENGYIRRWLALGVFGGVDPEALLSHDFVGGESRLEPSDGKETGGKPWRVHTATQRAVNLREVFQGQPLENVAAYLAIYVDSPRARDIILDTPDMVDLAVGSDDGVVAWLNGEEILRADAVRPCIPDQDRARSVKLRKGRNLLVLKVSQRAGDWMACARFLSSSGLPVGDLTYSTEPN